MLQQNNELPCNEQINYADVPGDIILPFSIELDTVNSILFPGPGENQRFCYIVTGVGLDQPQFKDLSHLVLGLCDQIKQNEIVNITVTIDGVAQDVIYGPGGNVELRTSANPDPPTGCPGLKINFGLNKVGGVMTFCFELTTPYPIGPNNVCLFGGDNTKSGLSICGPVCKSIQTCQAVGYQSATVCVPVVVTPFAIARETTTVCCGAPIITPGITVCEGVVNGSCYFTISQNICVEVPVEFGAYSSVGAPVVQCGEATNQDICSNCGGSVANLANKTSTSAATGFLSNLIKKSPCKCKGNK